MKNRFAADRGTHGSGISLSAAVSLLLLAGFTVLFDGMKRDVTEKEKENLEHALRQSVVSCYALEGIYPEDLTYIREHYGVRWDEHRFLVDYERVGENLPPDITVIPLDGQN